VEVRTPALTVRRLRSVGDMAELYRGERTGDPFYWFEFLEGTPPGMTRREKWVIMVSTQFGCAVNCLMCDAGGEGYHGNLTGEELLAQIRLSLSFHPEIRPDEAAKIKVRFTRMGEPSLNPAVLECLGHLGRSTLLPGLLPSVSSVAPKSPRCADFFAKLAALKDRYFSGGRFQLQFSVHSTDEDARRALVPVRKWSLEDIAAFGRDWVRPGDRRITLNFALGRDVPLDPAVLERVFSPERFLMKLSPIHPTRRSEEHGLTRSWFQDAPERVAILKRDLERRGLLCILGQSWPEEVACAGSCGQMGGGIIVE